MALNYYFLYDDPDPVGPLKICQQILSAGGVIGLWCLGFERRCLSPTFWRLFLVGDLVVFMSYGLLTPTPPRLQHLNPWPVLAFVAKFYVPYYIGLFVYGFRSQGIWKRRAPNTHKRSVPGMKKTYRVLLLAAVGITTYVFVVRLSAIVAMRKDEHEQARLAAEFDAIAQTSLTEVSRLLRWRLPDDHRLAMFHSADSVWLHYHGDPENIVTVRDEIALSGWGTNLTGVIETVPAEGKRIWDPPRGNVWVLSEIAEGPDPILKLWILDRDSGGIFFCMTRMSKIRNKPNQTGGR